MQNLNSARSYSYLLVRLKDGARQGVGLPLGGLWNIVMSSSEINYPDQTVSSLFGGFGIIVPRLTTNMPPSAQKVSSPCFEEMLSDIPVPLILSILYIRYTGAEGGTIVSPRVAEVGLSSIGTD